MAKQSKISIYRGKTVDGKPNPIDIHVGNRIRLRQKMLELSQEKLGDMLGLTFQQVQKYERGTNRIGASRLWDIACVLNVPVTFFYEDMSMELKQSSPRYQVTENIVKFKDKLVIFDEAIGHNDPMTQTETLELVNNYHKIPNRKLAELLFATIETAAKSNFITSCPPCVNLTRPITPTLPPLPATGIVKVSPPKKSSKFTMRRLKLNEAHKIQSFPKSYREGK